MHFTYNTQSLHIGLNFLPSKLNIVLWLVLRAILVQCYAQIIVVTINTVYNSIFNKFFSYQVFKNSVNTRLFFNVF